MLLNYIAKKDVEILFCATGKYLRGQMNDVVYVGKHLRTYNVQEHTINIGNLFNAQAEAEHLYLITKTTYTTQTEML